MRPQLFERSTIAVAHVHVNDGSYCRIIHALLLLRGCRGLGGSAHSPRPKMCRAWPRPVCWSISTGRIRSWQQCGAMGIAPPQQCEIFSRSEGCRHSLACPFHLGRLAGLGTHDDRDINGAALPTGGRALPSGSRPGHQRGR
jgi:hypothetical protein